MEILEMSSICLAVTEIFKRFIPKKFQDWINPMLAVGLGLFLGYSQDGMAGIQQGLAAGATAIAGYKVPKEMGKKIHVKN